MQHQRLEQLPNGYLEPYEMHPGQELKALLLNFYPNDKRGFLVQADSDFRADGELKNVFHDSFINYLVRKLVTATIYLSKEHKDHGDGKVKREIRSYLEYYSPFTGAHLLKVADILYRCLQASEDDFDDRSKRAVKYQADKYNWGCFACGLPLELKDSTASNYATSDHKWPKGMGGLSKQENIRLLCKECNNRYKKDYIEASDYHYEEIALTHRNYEDFEKKEKKYNRIYEFAVLAKSDFTCIGCGQPAYKVGELKMGRKSTADSWHYINLGAFCSSCNLKNDGK